MRRRGPGRPGDSGVVGVTATPILANSCARAATATEARYRINVPIAPSRGACVIALDASAAAISERVAVGDWVTARFFVCIGGDAGSATLTGLTGEAADLVSQLADSDVVVLIATDDTGSECAYSIGRACWERSIMTAGVVVADRDDAEKAIAALRPHARVLLPTADESDVTELLAALRA